MNRKTKNREPWSEIQTSKSRLSALGGKTALPDEGQPARVVVKRIRKIRPEGEAEGVVVRVQVERVLGRLILIGGEVETRGVEIGSYIN